MLSWVQLKYLDVTRSGNQQIYQLSFLKDGYDLEDSENGSNQNQVVDFTTRDMQILSNSIAHNSK